MWSSSILRLVCLESQAVDKLQLVAPYAQVLLTLLQLVVDVLWCYVAAGEARPSVGYDAEEKQEVR